MKLVRIWFAVFFFVCAGISAFLYVQEEVPYIQERLAAEKFSEAYLKKEDEKRKTSDSQKTVLWPTAIQEVDFEGLQAVNPDIIGWLYIPGTQVNDPILQHPEKDDYYLFHTPEKKPNKLGAIYMHHDADADFQDMHTILFGHNMKSGQRFGELSMYGNREFAAAHPDVWIFLPDEKLHGVVYSAYSCPADDLTYTVGYAAGQKSYKEFIRHTLDGSCIYPKETPEDTDRIFTLSTCTDSGNAEERFVVNCRIAGREKNE